MDIGGGAELWVHAAIPRSTANGPGVQEDGTRRLTLRRYR